MSGLGKESMKNISEKKKERDIKSPGKECFPFKESIIPCKNPHLKIRSTLGGLS